MSEYNPLDRELHILESKITGAMIQENAFAIEALGVVYEYKLRKRYPELLKGSGANEDS